MNTYKIKKSKLSGELTVPASKSHTLRAILFGAMGKGKTVINNYLASSDAQAMIDACRTFGASIDVTKDSIQITGLNGRIHTTEDVINAGNSGIVLRFCSAIGALTNHCVVVTGDYSIRHQRPIKPLLDGLQQLGVSVKSMRGDNYAPVIIQGPIKPGKALIDGEDSQPVSALMIAGAFAQGPIEIQVNNPGEKPWIALTCQWFDRLGISYKQNNYRHYHLPGKTLYEGFQYTVPGDLSSAAFPIAAALVTQSEIMLKNIDMLDSQGDKELIHIFKKMGARIEIDEKNKTLHVRKGSQLSGMSIDINDFVDAITILAVVACYADGETHIYNGAIAKQKECNRIRCISAELKKMGADIAETDDGLRIRKSQLKGSHLQSYHDHRMVMSLAVAAIGAEGESVIEGIDCVSKTYPNFVQDFCKIGALIK